MRHLPGDGEEDSKLGRVFGRQIPHRLADVVTFDVYVEPLEGRGLG
jgi:hypothetical protein